MVILVVCCGDGDGDGSRTSGTCTARGDCGGGAKSCGSSCWRCQLKIVVCKLQTAVELVALVVQVVDCGGNGARNSEAGDIDGAFGIDLIDEVVALVVVVVEVAILALLVVVLVMVQVVLIVEVARIIVLVELVVVCGNGGAGAGSAGSSRSSGGRGDGDAGGVSGGLLVVLVLSDGKKHGDAVFELACITSASGSGCVDCSGCVLVLWLLVVLQMDVGVKVQKMVMLAVQKMVSLVTIPCMATAISPFSSTKDTTNYARLCRLLVDVGSQALRDTFDKIHPPATLHAVLSSHSVHYATLQSLYRGRTKVLNPTQWGKLYPPVPSTVSSASFDITLLTVLLRNICSLSPPVFGWDSLPAPTHTSIADDIARVKYYRNTVYGHASQASVDDTSFNTYWPEIREALVRLGGPSYRAYIDKLEHDCMDPDIKKHYRELMKQWKEDDDSIKVKLEEMEESFRNSLEQTRGEVERIGSEVQEVKERLGTLTASLEKNKDEGQVRDELNKIKSEIGNINGKLDALTTSRQETKDDESIRDLLEQTRSEMKQMKEKLDTLTSSLEENKDRGSFDLSGVIDGIRQRYKSREGRLSPFPWCEEEFHVHLNDIYTRLKIINKDQTTGKTTDEIVNMSSIFKPRMNEKNECSEPRAVLIEGKPGFGKTTYCKKLIYDWATGKQEAKGYFPRLETVLLLRCRDIKSDLWEAIDDQLLPPREGMKEKFRDFIDQNQASVLLVLDGLDELPASKLPMVLKIIEGNELPKCHLVVTARKEAGMKVRKFFDVLFEIEGFTKEDAQGFIHKYFKAICKEDLAQKLLSKLRKDKILKEMTANPLNTALLCLLCEEFQGILPESRTELYLEITECVLRRYRKKKGLSETSEKLTEVYKTQLNHLGWIALNGLLEENLDFEESEFAGHKNDLTGFGFLSRQPGGSKLRPCRRYAFLHKSFQEFFAGFYLSCQLLNEEITPDHLVSDTRYFNELKQVLPFSCGIVSAHCKQTAVNLMASITIQVNKHGDNSVDVALECITECKRAKSDICLTLAKVFCSCLKLQSVTTFLGWPHAAPLAEVIKVNTTLETLRVLFGNIGDAGAASLADAIKVNTTLKMLHLNSNNIADAGAASLAEAIKVNTTLTWLSLVSNNIADAGAASLAEAVKVNTTLMMLYLNSNNIADAGAALLAEAIKVNTRLTRLSLNSNNIADAGAASLAEAIKVNTRLTKLSLDSNNIADAGAASLADAIKVNTTLTMLSLDSNNIADAGAASLADAIKVNTTLTSLSLDSNNIADAGAASLAEAIKVNTTLTLLDLNINNIADAGAASLADAIKVNTTLTSLSLGSNNIADAGAASLAEAIKVNTTLMLLDLNINNIADAGAASLAEAIKVNTTLTLLYLNSNNIADAGAASLAEAIKVNTTLILVLE
ncbi:hypothetical protein ACROYT_G027852 [Oculina patagonica]